MNRINQLIQSRLPPGSFGRNVITLMTGTTFAQAIPIAISPILTRLYSPDDFGVLAIFVSITAICGSIANGRYELAVVLPVSDEEAINVTALCVLVALGFSTALSIPIVLFHDVLLLRLGNPEIGLWLYFVPVAVFLIGLFNALNYFHVRTKRFRDIAKANVTKSFGAAAIQLIFGLARSGSTGLILGQLVSYISGNTAMARNLFHERALLNEVRLRNIKMVAQRYIDFPKFSLWSILANNLTYNLVNIFISVLFGASALGFYSLGNRVLGMPTMLVGTSFGQVFFQRATVEKNETGSARNIFLNTCKTLIVIGLPPFVLLYFVLEDLFALVFGAEWRIAGTYAKIMLPLFFVRFITAPLTTINSAFEKQGVSLVWQVSLFATSIFTMVIAKFSNLAITSFLKLFSVTGLILYLIALGIMYEISKGDNETRFRTGVD